VSIESLSTQTKRMTHTDGTGFFGMLGLAPGRYRVVAGGKEETVDVGAGKVVIAP
jgi:uncharacterized cupin superfamily protein